MGALVFLIGYYGICSCVLYEGGVIGQAKKLHRELSSGQRAAAALALILGAGLTVYWSHRSGEGPARFSPSAGGQLLHAQRLDQNRRHQKHHMVDQHIRGELAAEYLQRQRRRW